MEASPDSSVMSESQGSPRTSRRNGDAGQLLALTRMQLRQWQRSSQSRSPLSGNQDPRTIQMS
eukprot:9541045-Prorocentrum_lima.AAC.1